MGADKRISRTERSGRYGSDQPRDESDWRDRRDRDQERDRRWGEERRSDRFEGDRRGSRDSPEQRERKRRNSDRSEDGYHSDGDYPDQDFRREPGEEKKSKTIMLWGLSPHVAEDDICFAIDQLEGPQPVDVRLMKKKTGENHISDGPQPPPSLDHRANLLPPDPFSKKKLGENSTTELGK